MSDETGPFVSGELGPETIQGQLERILSSVAFARSKRLRSLLRFTVTQTLEGNGGALKEWTIGNEVLHRSDSFDPGHDSAVRVLASRLRVKLSEYYSNGGSEDPVVIRFRKGSYLPVFQRREDVQADLQKGVDKKLTARNFYSRARFLAAKFTSAALAESEDNFRRAIEADGGFPPAWAGLAHVCAFQAFLGFRRPSEAWPIARNAAETALKLDETSAEAHICLGLERAFYEWRWRDADMHFAKARERDSYSAAGHLWRTLACLIPTGSLSEACAEIRCSRELAPSAFLEEALALALYLSEQYEAALERWEVAEPPSRWLQWLRSAALAAMGFPLEAANVLEEILKTTPKETRVISMLGYAYAVTGRPEQAREMLRTLRERKREGETWVPNYDLALIHAGLGNQDDALAYLQQSLREKEPWAAFLSVDPRLDSLRMLPEFTLLARRIVLAWNEPGRAPRATPYAVRASSATVSGSFAVAEAAGFSTKS
jgi:tetratricopeptide (TPR) repeat protein